MGLSRDWFYLYLKNLLGSIDDLRVKLPRDLCCSTFHYFFDSALAGETFVVLSVLEDVDQLFGGHQVI